MDFFSKEPIHFDLAGWEGAKVTGSGNFESTSQPLVDNDQFVLFQMSGDGDKRLLTTTDVVPSHAGSDEKPDIKLQLDFDAFKISDRESVSPDTKATLQLVVGQEQPQSNLDKLFYCINGGLNLFDQFKGKKALPSDFKKSTQEAFGRKSISLPGGTGSISLKVLQHDEPSWWRKVFSFAQSNDGKELLSLIGFAGITQAALNTLGGMLDNLFEEKPKVLFESAPVKLAFSNRGRDELNGGLSTVKVSSLDEGFWLMARLSDYKKILDLEPVYYNGPGLLAEGSMDLTAAMSRENPFRDITYAVIRAKLKEVNLSDI